eukprot:1362821-Pyramimonas_sp.AAC.1
MGQADHRRMDDTGSSGPTTGLGQSGGCQRERRSLHGQALLRRARHDTPAGEARQRIQGELQVREMRAGHA